MPLPMDSVSQFVLGAAVAAAALGDRTRAWRAVVWGGVVATLPDLDVLIDHGDAIANMTRHRAESHALFWLTLVSPLLAWGIAAWHRERRLFLRWWWAVWLALVTHPLLDAMTIYGTRLLLPFADHPFAVGSLFVIDPLYTLLLLLGAFGFWRWPGVRGRRWNRRGLVVSCAYAAWSVIAQQWGTAVANAQLLRRGIVTADVVVTPAPLQTCLWRFVAITEDRAYEGFWSVFDGAREIEWLAIDRGRDLLDRVRSQAPVQQLLRFSGGCVKCERDGDGVRLTDLRMGQEPFYIFSFVVAHLDAGGAVAAVAAPMRSGARIDVARELAWLWARMWGGDVPAPR